MVKSISPPYEVGIFTSDLTAQTLLVLTLKKSNLSKYSFQERNRKARLPPLQGIESVQQVTIPALRGSVFKPQRTSQPRHLEGPD
jgi:hypothetical protein